MLGRGTNFEKTVDKLEQSDEYDLIVELGEDGVFRKRVISREDLEDSGMTPPDRSAFVYPEGAANPVERVEHTPHDLIDNKEVNGWVPRENWKAYKAQKAIEEALHRKTKTDIPWKPIIALAVIAAIALILTQGGFI